MSILGIGIDVIQNKRINLLIKNKLFISRTFSKNEIKFSKKILNKTNYFSGWPYALKSFLKRDYSIENSSGISYVSGYNDSTSMTADYPMQKDVDVSTDDIDWE